LVFPLLLDIAGRVLLCPMLSRSDFKLSPKIALETRRVITSTPLEDSAKINLPYCYPFEDDLWQDLRVRKAGATWFDLITATFGRTAFWRKAHFPSDDLG
jgi:hypothetical protein